MKKIFFFLAAMALAITANAKVTTISPDAENDALRLAVHYAEDGDIIEMTEGTYVQCNNSYVAFDGKSVTVKAAEGANVVLQLQVPITLANGGKATLQGIKIDASRLTELADWYEHVIYPTDATEGKELVMDGCELYGFNINKSAIYSSSSNTLALCDVKNCYFHDNMKSCFFFEGASIAELSVVNSTFANIATDASGYYAGPIDVRNPDAKVTIDHCTFYDCKAMSTDYATVTMKGPQAANVVISNNIFALSSDETAMRAIRNNVNAKNCLTFNYKYSSDSNPGLHSTVEPTDCKLNVDPKFVDAANGNFALDEGSPALGAGTDGSNLGDPRWNVVAEPEPVEYTVTATVNPAETGTVEGAGEYVEGTTATLTATPAEGYQFVNWTKGEEVVSTENPYTFTVTADIVLVANFELIPVVEPEKPEPTYTENNLNPFAFGLESELVEGALNVTYRLNNSNATSVNIIVYNGEEVVATIPGTTTIGKNTVEVPTADLPGGVKLTWAVEVNGTSVAAPTAETKIYSFFHPSGLDIDINPENETFGMLLVNEGMHSVKSKTEGYVSAQFGAGIFAFTPSFDLLPNGDQPGYNGGIEFTTTRADGTGTAYSPRRIRISEDGRIFVTSLNTDGNYLWEVNADNMNEWTSVFKGTLNDNKELVDAEGNFIAAPNNGFDVKGAGENLQLAMYSVNLSGITAAAMSGFRLHEYNLGTATEWTTAPSKAIVEGKYAINYTGTQVEYDNEGGLWICSYRGTANDANPGLVHINKDGVEDAKLIWSNVRQAGIRFNKDFTKLVVAGNNGAAKKATIYTISKDANGAPVLTQEAVVDMANVGNNLNDFAWDYAGNLYACGNSSEKLAAWAMPYSGEVETPAASKYAFQLEAAVVEPVELVGVVKRALTIGESTVVLTHEVDGTPHIYNIVGEEIAEVSLEGVVPVNPDNLGDYLAISDIAVTEDGKLVANNYMRVTNSGYTPDAGYLRGENRFYIWNDLAGAPSIWFTSSMTSNSIRSDQGITMAVKGTSTNAQVLTTGVHNSGRGIRMSLFTLIDGAYVDPAVNHNEYYRYISSEFKSDAVYNEAAHGVLPELSASPLGEKNWVMDNIGMAPSEFSEPVEENGGNQIINGVLADDVVGKKFNGASYLTVGAQAIMVAPYVDAEGKLAGVKVLDITAGLASATEVAVADLDAAVEATAAATAVVVDEDKLIITLVGDATLYTLTAELTQNPGPGTALDNIAVEAKAIKMIKNGQLIIIKNGVQYNVQGQVIK